jgi:hypothetical protein
MAIDLAFERLQRRLKKMDLRALRELAAKTEGTPGHVPWKTLYNVRAGIVKDPGVLTAARIERALKS